MCIRDRIALAGFIPILEPEIDIHAPDKKECEVLLKEEIIHHLSMLDDNIHIMFKLTIPDTPDFYRALMSDPHVVRIVALSGGYTLSLIHI